MRFPLLGALLVAAASAACGAAPGAGSSLTLRGTLVLKGSAPRVTPVLVRSPSEQWELQEVLPATASALQNRTVEATGTVVRASPQGMALPALRVTSLHATE